MGRQEIHRRPARNKDRARADKLPRISAPVRAWAEGRSRSRCSFRGPFAHHNFDALPRQIHEMQAEDGRIFLIYLEPIVSTGDPGRLYEAIFD